MEAEPVLISGRTRRYVGSCADYHADDWVVRARLPERPIALAGRCPRASLGDGAVVIGAD